MSVVRGWREQRPEPARFWIRWSPRSSAAAGAHLDLATGVLLAGRGAPPAPDLETLLRRPGPVYVPPSPRGSHFSLDETGLPLVLQVAPGGERRPIPPGSVEWVDPLPALARGDGRFDGLEAESWVVLPLIGGLLTDDEWVGALERLATAGVAGVGLVRAPLGAVDRRSLADGMDDGDRAMGLFHRQAPSEVSVARSALRVGLRVLRERPLGAAQFPGRANLELAGVLASRAEVLSWLGGRELESADLYRAARLVEDEEVDFAALAEDDNLRVVPWLSPDARAVIEHALSEGVEAALRAAEGLLS